MVEDTSSWFSPRSLNIIQPKFSSTTTSDGDGDAYKVSDAEEGSSSTFADQRTPQFYFAPVPRRMRYAATIQRFLKVMAMVWAGSQVTKLARAAGALALAPLVDKGLAWFTVKFKFESKGRAFTTIIGMCLVPGLVLFLTVTLLWA